MMQRLIRRGGFALALAVASASCGKDSSGPKEASEFSGTLAGAFSGSRTGSAHFEYVQLSGTILHVSGSSEDESFDFDIHLVTSGQPTVGEYQYIGVGGTHQFTSEFFLDPGPVRYSATGGSVIISSISATTVKGSFNITYGDTDGVEPRLTATFVGTFTAHKCQDC